MFLLVLLSVFHFKIWSHIKSDCSRGNGRINAWYLKPNCIPL